MIDAETLRLLVERDVEAISDVRVRDHVRTLLVEPSPVLRDWDYGEPGEQHLCWTVMEDRGRSDTAIAYCEQGFGPDRPWGLVWSGDDGAGKGSIGMDSGWFSSLEEAVYDSVTSVLPIWKLYKREDGRDVRLSEELSWDEAWRQCDALREADPASRYMVSHTARDDYGRPIAD